MHVNNIQWGFFVNKGVGIYANVIATLAFGPRCAVDRGGTTTYFQFLQLFGQPHCKMMCNSRFEKKKKCLGLMYLCRCCIVVECMSDEYETRMGEG